MLSRCRCRKAKLTRAQLSIIVCWLIQHSLSICLQLFCRIYILSMQLYILDPAQISM